MFFLSQPTDVADLKAAILTQAFQSFPGEEPSNIKMPELCQAAMTTTAFLNQNAIKAEEMVRGKASGSKRPAIMQWFKLVIDGANKSYKVVSKAVQGRLSWVVEKQV